MAQYGIGLSALNAFSEAIDVTSNNIANAQTVGYKSAEYVFADQFFKAQNPQARDRAGMGTSRQIIRRNNTYGTLQQTQNPLDLAIAGPGMFILAKQVDGSEPKDFPEKYQYTRNGQFAVDNKRRIVNENGLFLVGYGADAQGIIRQGSTSVLTLEEDPLQAVATTESTIELNLDNRIDSLAGRKFDQFDTTSYSQATSQTIYDSLGKSHTLVVYYKKVNQADLTLIGNENGDGTTFTYNPKQALGAAPEGEQATTIATTAYGDGSEASLENCQLTLLSGTDNTEGAIYKLKLNDGTLLTIKQTVEGDPTANPTVNAEYEVTADRFAVFATIDGIPVGSGTDPTKTITINGLTYEEQTSLGTIAFVSGKNIDSLARDSLGTPDFQSKMEISAGDNQGTDWNSTPNGSFIVFNLFATNTTGYSMSGMTYKNDQDGSPTSQLTNYSFDVNGKLVAQYDNGKTKVMGQLKLATFNNFEGLVPVGDNAFESSALSGKPTVGAPNGSEMDTPTGSQLGAIRSQTIEQSNVDLTAQLVKLMVLQRNYSAASQATKVQVATLVDDTLRIGQ